MEEQFLVYYCSVCNVCKQPSESSSCMKFCSGCKLVQYCCSEHQKQDWRQHRELCKGIQQIMSKKQMAHVYQDAKHYLPDDLPKWNALRMSVVKLVEITLNRNLNHLEMQMCLFPPVCQYCHLYKTNQMITCSECKSLMYCSEDHQEKDVEHRSICKLFRLSFDADMLRYREQTTLYECFDFSYPSSQIKGFPENMEALIKLLFPALTTKEVCISEMLSFYMTLFYVISKIAKMTSNKLTVHVVGADAMELVAVQTIPLIHQLISHVTHLNIVLVGPSVDTCDFIPLCSEVSNVNVSSVCMLYHEYVANPKFVTPNIIAALNCGFCEFEANEEKDTWKDSLCSILSFSNTFVLITSYTKKESETDLQKLLRAKCKDMDCQTIVECQENPFSSLCPQRDWENQGVYYVNKFISVLKV
ncbi:uncharacterized protein LOC128999682 [Macrosteles quadrilineatus]|uniref:uncharacterized protein LOC128999682 n=1 Tax=Macrosteles quadrilineatus TaxID=74068 RepID=UPI0023E350F4|nr:uncharacterized protein LOC128999682 [Macrosteles quadrilineatus]